jgi:hypothetical protein
MSDPERRSQWTGRVIRSAEEERGADVEFWKRMTPDERVAVLWDMALEAETLRTGRADQPRLQRSVFRIQRA